VWYTITKIKKGTAQAARYTKMTLKQIEHSSKEENGMIYEATTYELSEHYKLEKYDTIYSNGEKATTFYVKFVDYTEAKENYMPDIIYNYYRMDSKKVFEVRTTTYGSLDSEEIKKFIAAYQEAAEVAEILTKTFC